MEAKIVKPTDAAYQKPRIGHGKYSTIKQNLEKQVPALKVGEQIQIGGLANEAEAHPIRWWSYTTFPKMVRTSFRGNTLTITRVK